MALPSAGEGKLFNTFLTNMPTAKQRGKSANSKSWLHHHPILLLWAIHLISLDLSFLCLVVGVCLSPLHHKEILGDESGHQPGFHPKVVMRIKWAKRDVWGLWKSQSSFSNSALLSSGARKSWLEAVPRVVGGQQHPQPPLRTATASPQLWQPKVPPDIATVPWGAVADWPWFEHHRCGVTYWLQALHCMVINYRTTLRGSG